MCSKLETEIICLQCMLYDISIMNESIYLILVLQTRKSTATLKQMNIKENEQNNHHPFFTYREIANVIVSLQGLLVFLVLVVFPRRAPAPAIPETNYFTPPSSQFVYNITIDRPYSKMVEEKYWLMTD